MKKIAVAIFALLAAINAYAVGPQINGNQINPQTAISIATFTVTGAGGMSVTNSVTASSFTASGSGFKGSGTGLTGTASSLTAGNVTTNANLTGPITSVGNATTIAGPVPQAAVNLSTITTALALYLPLAGGNMTGQLTTSSTITVQGNAFSVGGSALVVSGGKVGIGTTSPATTLDVYGIIRSSATNNNASQFIGNSNGTYIATGSTGTFILANSANGNGSCVIHDGSGGGAMLYYGYSNYLSIVAQDNNQFSTTTTSGKVWLTLNSNSGGNSVLSVFNNTGGNYAFNVACLSTQ